ncbi:transposase, partial [Parasutterella sp.]|uniref:transposase n=1 Tax=Parasutterella sp. TaxID=2049037 RepID=UPI003AF09639
PQEVKDWLLELLQSCRELQKRLNKISKYLKEYADNDEICQKIMSVPGIGPITATRLKATIGDIQRFENRTDAPEIENHDIGLLLSET